MKILITGGTGLLGKALAGSINAKYEIIATFIGNYEIPDTKQIRYRKLDVRDGEGYLHLFKDFRPEVAIHTAGVNSPDYAQKNSDEAHEINVGGTQNILKAAEACGSKFIYISSNAIYDGEHAPYPEEAEPDPVNRYGQLKLEGEMIARKANVPWAIVRPILMYGWNYAFERPNVLTIGISKLRKTEKFYVYDNVYYNPLYYYSCAEAIWAIIEKNKFEIFNVGGKDRLSIYAFMREAAKVFALDEGLLMPVQQGFFKELVKRPRDTSYATSKMENILGITPLSVPEGLARMRQEEASIYA